MSSVLTRENQQGTEQGIEDFADDIEVLLAFSEVPQRYQDIRNYFEEDETYFEGDLGYIKGALDYLQDEDRVKVDLRLDGESPDTAYSISDYDAI